MFVCKIWYSSINILMYDLNKYKTPFHLGSIIQKRNKNVEGFTHNLNGLITKFDYKVLLFI